MGKKLKRAFGLIRVSTTEQDVLSQKLQLQRIAESMGYSIADEREGHDFFSEKISGFDEEYDYDRDSIVQLKEQIYIRRPDAIFCLELSRLTRTAVKVSHYIDMLSLIPKIPMYFADYQIWTIDPETLIQNGEAVMTLYGGAKSVEIERERIRSRTTRGRDVKAEQGFYVGHLADGYKWEYNDAKEKIIVRDEQRDEMIKTIFELYLNKDYSIAAIRDYLNSIHYPTANKYRYEHQDLFKGYKRDYTDRSGNVYSREDVIWSDGMVSGVLKNEWYVGVRRYHGKEYPIKAIVDKELWDGCQEKLKKCRTNVSTAKHPYLLSSLLFCGVCGRKMYGHTDGGYGDMYYCSSYEYGKKQKCGLRWVRRQNMEAIIMEVVKRRVYSDVTWGRPSPFSDFFSIDKTQISSIEDRIKDCKSNIDRLIAENEQLNKKIDRLVLDKYSRDEEEWIARYDRLIDGEEKKIKQRDADIVAYRVRIDKLKKEIKMLKSVEDKLVEIRNLDDYSKAKALVQSVIQRITLFNSDKTSTIIKIEYVNGKTDTAIYNPIKMRNKFIVLSMDEWSISQYLKYDDDKKKIVFNGCYLACGNSEMTLFDENEPEETPEQKEIRETEGRVKLGRWDTPENKKRYVDEMVKLGIEKCEAIRQYEMAVENGFVWRDISDGIRFFEARGCVVFKDEVSVLDYIKYKKNTTLCVFPYSDLLPMSERGEEVRRYHIEYGKRYYSGNPSSVPYVDKDADYEQICRERKRLYNRIDKIKHKKSLTQEQKNEQIFRIREQLEAYRYQIKYLPTNKKGKDLIAKYGAKQ